MAGVDIQRCIARRSPIRADEPLPNSQGKTPVSDLSGARGGANVVGTAAEQHLLNLFRSLPGYEQHRLIEELDARNRQRQ